MLWLHNLYKLHRRHCPLSEKGHWNNSLPRSFTHFWCRMVKFCVLITYKVKPYQLLLLLDSYVREPTFLRVPLTLVSDSGSFHQQITATRGCVVHMLERNICMTSLSPNCNCKCKMPVMGLRFTFFQYLYSSGLTSLNFDNALKCWQY